MIVELQLPFPPSVNRLWRTGRKRVYKSDEYTAWLEEAGWRAKEQRPGAIVGPYVIDIRAARPDKRRRDLGNLEKAVSDLLESIGIISDDCWAEGIHLSWAQGEGVYVRVQDVGVEC